MSAIDWLQTPQNPLSLPAAQGIQDIPRPDTSVPDVTVAPLDGETTHTTGLLPPDVTGLPKNLWSGSDAEVLAAALARALPQTLPTAQELLMLLLLAENDPSTDATQTITWLTSRIDGLVALGAIEPALLMTELAKPDQHPEIFDRYFDLGLLTGAEDQVCTQIMERPALTPDTASHIYCAARLGQYENATLLFGTSASLGVLTPAEETLLGVFMDPELFEDQPLPDPPRAPSVLEFRLFEAAGVRLDTRPLDAKFAHLDLTDRVGWKAQLEAAERLARYGTLSPNHMLGLYTERQAAASGSVWDRVRALQSFEAAIATQDIARIEAEIAPLWYLFQKSNLGALLAEMIAGRLSDLALPGVAGERAARLQILAQDTDPPALKTDASEALRFLVSLSTKEPELELAPDELARQLGEVIAGGVPDQLTQSEKRPEQLGMTLLTRLAQIEEGRKGDRGSLVKALADLKGLGFHRYAQRMAVEMLILQEGL